jgi:hypothetical protein
VGESGRGHILHGGPEVVQRFLLLPWNFAPFMKFDSLILMNEMIEIILDHRFAIIEFPRISGEYVFSLA